MLRVHNNCLNTQRKLNPAKNLQCQETAFQVNPWHFAKKSCQDSRQNVEPNFSADDAYNYFTLVTSANNSRYNTPENPE